MSRSNITKDTVPEGFSLGLALFDAVPVIFFGIATTLLAKMTDSPIVFIGGLICFISGMLKVLWKVIVVIKKKNVWFLFTQMRKGMPLGFLILIIGVVIACFTKDLSALGAGLLRPAPIICIVLFFAGMGGMGYLGSKLDSADPRSNWIEQGCNTAAQAFFLLAMILAYLH